MTDIVHTSEMISDGQVGVCCKCKKQPILDCDNGKEHEVYDGCIGKLKGNVMNACCGHGDSDCAYVQFWDLTRISGEEAIEYQRANGNGDGYAFALSAMDHGSSAKDAVEYAKTRSCVTGGNVRVFKVK